MIINTSELKWTRAPKQYTITEDKVEMINEAIQRLGSVVTNNGYSDWASVDVDASIK